jgi:DNA-binding response OmpR family regulator
MPAREMAFVGYIACGSIAMAKIIVVEDDTELCQKISEWLKFEHYKVEFVHDGREALYMLQSAQHDLIILDWELPNLSGLEICRELRAAGEDAPIIMLTGKGQIRDKELGLDAGADDYLTKPFNMKELAARIRAQLRRTSKSRSNTLQVRDLELDPLKFIVRRNGTEIKLLRTEFRLLEFLMRHPDEPFTSEVLLARVWDTDSSVGTDAIRSCIKRLRKKLNDTDDASTLIETVHGLGYRLRR